MKLLPINPRTSGLIRMNKDQWKKTRAAGKPAVYAGRQGNADVFQAPDQKIDSEDTSDASDDTSNHPSGLSHSQHILFGMQTSDNDVPEVTFNKRSGRRYMHFLDSELGYSDYVSIDVSEYQPSSINGSELVIEESRQVLLEFIHEIIASCQSDEAMVKLQHHYQVLRKECRSINLVHMNLADIRCSLLVLTVYERLLLGKSIKLVAACSPTVHEDSVANYLGMECDEQGGDEVGHAFLRGRRHMNFCEEELGHRDSISVDISEYVNISSTQQKEEDKTLVVEENREALLGFIDDVIDRCQSDQELMKFQLKCTKLREACCRVSLTQHWVPSHVQRSLLGLAVYERLLTGKPIKLVARSLEEDLGLRCAGKGGYVVTGEFVKGGGQRTVYLSFDVFQRDADLFVDMSDEYGCYPFPVSAGHLVHAISRMSQSTKEWKNTKGEQLLQWLRYECIQYSNNPLTALLDCASENKHWIDHQWMCLDLATLESGLYGKPIPLLSPSAEVFMTSASSEKHAAYVKLIREAISRVSA